MHSSKWGEVRFFLLALTVTMMTACVRGPNRPGAGDGVQTGVVNQASDFRVSSITGQPTPFMASETWKIENRKQYDFRVCIMALGTNVALAQGHKFRVGFPDGSQKPVVTDTDGCFNWQEDVRFNIAADSMFLEKVREIKGQDIYQGATPIRIGINPWSTLRNEPSPEVVDLNRTQIPKNKVVPEVAAGEVAAGLFSDDASQQLLINSQPNFSIIHDGDLTDGKKIKVLLTMNPYIEPRGLSGRKDPFHLLTGKYRIRVQLIGTLKVKNGTEEKRMILTPDLAIDDVTLNNTNVLTFKKETTLNRRWVDGNIKMALRIDAVDAPFELKPFEALYDLGKFRQLFSKNITLEKGLFTGEDFHYGKYLKSTDNFETMLAQGWAKKLPPVEFSAVKPRFKRIKSGETATRRTIIYQVTSRVTDSVTGDPVSYMKMFVETPFEKINGGEERPGKEIETDIDGLLTWEDELTHVYYEPERYFIPDAYITHRPSGYRFQAKMAINPWDYGWTFGFDYRFFDKEQLKEDQNTPIRKSLFMVDAFRYQTIRFRYEIDEFMTLNVKKAVVMTFDPLVQRYAIGMGRKFEPLRDGIYLVKVALVKYFIDPFPNSMRLVRDKEQGENLFYMKQTSDFSGDFDVDDELDPRKGQYTDVVKKLIRVQAGRITSPVEFSMRDLRMMSIRSALMVQIETIDERKLMNINLADEKLRNLDLEREQYQEFKDSIAHLSADEQEAFEESYISERQAGMEVAQNNLQNWVDENVRQAQHQRDKVAAFYARRADEMEQAYQASLAKTGNSAGESDSSAPGGFDDRRRSSTQDIVPEEVTQHFWDQREMMSDRERVFFNEERESLDKLANFQEIYKFQEDIKGEGNGEGEAETPEERWAQYRRNLALGDEEFESLITRARENLSQVVTGMKDKNQDWDRLYQKAAGEQDEFGIVSIPPENASPHFQLIDYLSSLKSFVDDSGLGLPVTKSDKNRMAINNYTVNPAAPFVDLNYLVEDAGIEKRTFIGPCTLVLNDNLSDMRPTNTIDEKFCDRMDCSDRAYMAHLPGQPPVDNSRFEDSAYHDSLTTFRNVHVDDIIEQHLENEKKYRITMRAIGAKKTFIDTYNLNYVALDDSPMDAFVDGCDIENNEEKCFTTSTEGQESSDEFYLKFSQDLFGPLSDQELVKSFYCLSDEYIHEKPSYEVPSMGEKALLMKAINDGKRSEDLSRRSVKVCKQSPHTNLWVKKMTLGHSNFTQDNTPPIVQIQNLLRDDRPLGIKDSMRLCNLMAQGTVSQINKSEEISEGLSKDIHWQVFSKCARSLKKTSLENEIDSSNVFFWTQRMRVKQTGRYQHLNGKNMNINVGSSTYVGYETEAGSEFIGTLGGNFQIGVSLPIGVTFSGGASAGVAIGAAEKEGVAKGNSVGIDIGTYLVVQKASMFVEIKRHEKCATLQVNGRFVEEFVDAYESPFKDESLDNNSLTAALGRGYFICEGDSQEHTEDTWVHENYFYITQHFTAGEMLDDANLLNHVWLLALRGTKDFATFAKAATAERITSKGVPIPDASVHEYPLARLDTLYRDIIPSTPGLYSVFTPAIYDQEKAEPSVTRGAR